MITSRRSGRTAPDGEHPCLDRPPVMTDQRHLVATRGVDQRSDVGKQQTHRVVRHLRRLGRLAVATKVGGPDLVAGLDQHRDLVTPGERQLRKAVEQQGQPVRTAHVGDRHLQLDVVHGNRPVRQWVHQPMMPVADPFAIWMSTSA